MAELAKENKSALKVDVQKTNEQNEIFITLDSLNFWVKEEFGITIFDNHLVIKNKSSKNSSQPHQESLWLLLDSQVDIPKTAFRGRN